MPVIQRQSTDPAKSITSADVGVSDRRQRDWHLDAANQGASNSHIL